jgi:hypothetical protein
LNIKCVIGFERKKAKGLNRIAKKEKKMTTDKITKIKIP